MPIISKPRKELDFDTILSLTTEYEIYQYYLGRRFQAGEALKSPFREERTPSFIIGNKYGFLHHKDFGDPTKHGNCVQFVQQLYGLSYHQALVAIDRDLGLGIMPDVTPREPIKRTEIPSSFIKEPKETIIKVKAKKFTQEELKYWYQYYLNLDDLKKGEVYSVGKLWINGVPIGIKKTELTFAYHEKGKFKIYKPLSISKERKWVSNIPLTTMEGLENIKEADKALIIKSRKDRLISEKFLNPHSCSTQNESIAAITTENIDYIKQNSKEQWMWFDPDYAGVESCKYFNQFGFKYLNIPKDIFLSTGLKDAADYIKAFGPDKLQEFYNNKVNI